MTALEREALAELKAWWKAVRVLDGGYAVRWPSEKRNYALCDAASALFHPGRRALARKAKSR